jgi:hypothetical protein
LTKEDFPWAKELRCVFFSVLLSNHLSSEKKDSDSFVRERANLSVMNRLFAYLFGLNSPNEFRDLEIIGENKLLIKEMTLAEKFNISREQEEDLKRIYGEATIRNLFLWQFPMNGLPVGNVGSLSSKMLIEIIERMNKYDEEDIITAFAKSYELSLKTTNPADLFHRRLSVHTNNRVPFGLFKSLIKELKPLLDKQFFEEANSLLAKFEETGLSKQFENFSLNSFLANGINLRCFNKEDFLKYNKDSKIDVKLVWDVATVVDTITEWALFVVINNPKLKALLENGDNEVLKEFTKHVKEEKELYERFRAGAKILTEQEFAHALQQEPPSKKEKVFYNKESKN